MSNSAKILGPKEYTDAQAGTGLVATGRFEFVRNLAATALKP